MPAARFLYVGTYTETITFGSGKVFTGNGRGIHRFRFDANTGALTDAGVTEDVANPSFVARHPDRPWIYCVNEVKAFDGHAGGAVSAFRMDPDSGALTRLNMKPSHGADPCHLKVDHSGRYLIVANYSSGSVCVLPLGADGALGDASDVIQHEGSSVHPVRQTGPHSHAVEIAPDNRFVFVPELGLDKVMNYAFDSARGKLTPNPAQPFVTIAPGAGPRQIVMHPDGRLAFLINELNSTVSSYRYDAAAGTLAEIVTVPTLPADTSSVSTCAEVQVSPDGRFLYGSNRGHDSIVMYAIDAGSGGLTLLGHERTGGRIPRNFALDPGGRFVAVANQDSDNIVMFAVDPATGHLRPTGTEIAVGTPVCVRFF